MSTSQRQPGAGGSLQFDMNDVLAEAPRVDTVVLIIQDRLSPNDLSLDCGKNLTGIRLFRADGVLVLLVGCRPGGDGTLNSRKDTDVMQNASASEEVPVIVVSAKREVDSQDRPGQPSAAHTPTLAGHSDTAAHFSR